MANEQKTKGTKSGRQSETAAMAERRRERAALQLRLNLQRRKAQIRARRNGAEDDRADGLPASAPLEDDAGP
jgi:hypothetical protein